VVRSNGTEAIRGAAAAAGRAFPFTRVAQIIVPALINGAAGLVMAADGRPITLVKFTITGTKIAAIDLIDDSRCIAEADLAIHGSLRNVKPAHDRLTKGAGS
jgi:RNA polymerase sigma-70 factor (ECF subfamily)